MSRLGRLWSEIEGSNRANCDSSNQQFTHGTFLPSGHGEWVPPYNLTRFWPLVARVFGLRLSAPATEKMGTTSAAGEAFMALDLLTIAGLAGSALIVVAYFANQQGLLRAENWRYSLANLVGAVLMLVSLISAWNLPAAIVEGFWGLISIYGLLKHGGWLGLR
jgi:hypothetical protein